MQESTEREENAWIPRIQETISDIPCDIIPRGQLLLGSTTVPVDYIPGNALPGFDNNDHKEVKENIWIVKDVFKCAALGTRESEAAQAKQSCTGQSVQQMRENWLSKDMKSCATAYSCMLRVEKKTDRSTLKRKRVHK